MSFYVESGENVLLWEDPVVMDDVTKYHIYREVQSNGNYVLIGEIAADLPNSYTDKEADSSVQSYRYHIKAADGEGNESEPSNEHKTVHLTVNQGLNGNINLNWDNYEGIDYNQVTLLRGTSPDDLVIIAELPADNLSYTDISPPAGEYFYQLIISLEVECEISRRIFFVKSSIIEIDKTSSTIELSIETKIYPNPLQDILYIEADRDMVLSIIDNLGQVLISGKVKSGINEIETKQLTDGLYVLRLTDRDVEMTHRLIITD